MHNELTVNFPFQDDIIISLPFSWRFEDVDPTIYEAPITVMLTPYKEEMVEINSTALDLYLENKSLLLSDEIYGINDLADISNYGKLPTDCTLVNEFYEPIRTWGELGNCTRCLWLSFNVRV